MRNLDRGAFLPLLPNQSPHRAPGLPVPLNLVMPSWPERPAAVALSTRVRVTVPPPGISVCDATCRCGSLFLAVDSDQRRHKELAQCFPSIRAGLGETGIPKGGGSFPLDGLRQTTGLFDLRNADYHHHPCARASAAQGQMPAKAVRQVPPRFQPAAVQTASASKIGASGPTLRRRVSAGSRMILAISPCGTGPRLIGNCSIPAKGLGILHQAIGIGADRGQDQGFRAPHWPPVRAVASARFRLRPRRQKTPHIGPGRSAARAVVRLLIKSFLLRPDAVLATDQQTSPNSAAARAVGCGWSDGQTAGARHTARPANLPVPRWLRCGRRAEPTAATIANRLAKNVATGRPSKRMICQPQKRPGMIAAGSFGRETMPLIVSMPRMRSASRPKKNRCVLWIQRLQSTIGRAPTEGTVFVRQ